MKTNHQQINQTSGKVEYYTPQPIIEAARKCMGGIDLDPASSESANKRVKANAFYTQEDDGLHERWFGRVWMNHPFGRRLEAPVCSVGGVITKEWVKWAEDCKARGLHPVQTKVIAGNDDWIQKLVREWGGGRMASACCITFAATSEKWFRPLLNQPQCFLWPRTNYLLPDGSTMKGVTKGSVVTYFGPNVQRFKDAFRELGTVKV
jgi:hypothetical protein